MDLAQEITNHLEWIDQIASLLSSESLDEEDLQEITGHHKCELGHWLDSEGAEIFKDVPEYNKLVDSHEAFHKLAGTLLTSMQQGKEEAALQVEEQFLEKSHEVISYLQVLQEKSVDK